ncbi:uncharacterized protein G2W53_033392 [Senna tora]|uniref:Uncharacterized protein n=1 Tax=Senna tora TaxID=362788 RepID=A0A834T171_9FABA|nr:uncharacterized protein G2W53_033392 [Senna tora]
MQREVISFTNLCNNMVDMFFMNSFQILSGFSVQNVFTLDFTKLPCNHESCLSINSTGIPKYNAKQMV